MTTEGDILQRAMEQAHDGPLIATDAHRITDEPRTSGATYLRSLLEEWAKLPAPPRLLLLVPRLPLDAEEPVLRAPHVTLAAPEKPFTPTGSLRAQCRWQQCVIPPLLAKHRPDVYFSPFHQAPLFPLRQKVVTTIHDLCFLGDPQWSLSAIVHRTQVLTACLRSTHLISVSRFTAAVLNQWRPSTRAMTTTVQSGTDAVEAALPDARRLVADLADCGHAIEWGRYFFWIGFPDIRKNIEGLFDAFALFSQENADATGYRLVIVAPEATHPSLREKARARGVEPLLVLLPQQDAAVRDALYCGAAALVFPSHCEGFGYPVLEAMAQGCPPVATRHSPAREIVGDVFPLSEDLQPANLARRMAHAASLSPEERAALSERLRERARQFSKKAMAEKTLRTLLAAARDTTPLSAAA